MAHTFSPTRRAQARHEVCHGAYALTCDGLTVASITLTHTEVRWAISPFALALHWGLHQAETLYHVICAIGVLRSPYLCFPQTERWPGSHDEQHLREWELAWRRLRITAQEMPNTPWTTLVELADEDVSRWAQQSGATEALTWLARGLTKAGALSGREWLTLWRSRQARPLWSEITGV